MRAWLSRNMRPRNGYVELLYYAVIYIALLTIQDVARASGWWPQSFLTRCALFIVLDIAIRAILDLFLSLLKTKRWLRQ